MSTQPYPSREAGQVSFSPYDLQITNSTAKYTGMDVFFSVTTITEVYSAVISYVAWTSTSLNIASG